MFLALLFKLQHPLCQRVGRPPATLPLGVVRGRCSCLPALISAARTGAGDARLKDALTSAP